LYPDEPSSIRGHSIGIETLLALSRQFAREKKKKGEKERREKAGCEQMVCLQYSASVPAFLH